MALNFQADHAVHSIAAWRAPEARCGTGGHVRHFPAAGPGGGFDASDTLAVRLPVDVVDEMTVATVWLSPQLGHRVPVSALRRALVRGGARRRCPCGRCARRPTARVRRVTWTGPPVSHLSPCHSRPLDLRKQL
jgi:hypothetical protein